MALEATHIRFAIDIQDDYKIKDLGQYILGSIYPDSRYISKINRELTHNKKILESDFALSDFNKGWQAHQLCDIIQRSVFRQNISLFSGYQSEGYHEDEWIDFTAAKIISDMKDMQSFNIQIFLRYLNFNYCPNHEDVAQIQEYNQIITDLYKNKREMKIDDYITMWNKFGITKELGQKVREKVYQFQDDEMKNLILSCYDKMILFFNEKYKNSIKF